jgi:hypothetical protein
LPTLCCAEMQELNILGACSLEFQSVMQILTEYLLKWDTKRPTSKGIEILGAVLAFAGADEEKGRKTKTLH